MPEDARDTELRPDPRADGRGDIVALPQSLKERATLSTRYVHDADRPKSRKGLFAVFLVIVVAFGSILGWVLYTP